MKLVGITNDKNFNGEAELIVQFFQQGLDVLHLRKPDLEINEYKAFLDKIPKEYQSKMVVHYHSELLKEYDLKGIHFSSTQEIENIDSKFTVSKSCHSFEELENCDKRLDYAFLSPVFNSISKQGYKSNFEDKTELKKRLTEFRTKNKLKVLALGGIDNTNIKDVKNIGFDGAALLGHIWEPALNNQPEETIKRFKAIQQLAN